MLALALAVVALKACAVAAGDGQFFRVHALSKYPGYGGSLEVSGYVDVQQHEDGAQSLRYALVGADPRCTGNEAFSGNSCGIHIHAGTSCADAGDHHWTPGSLVSSDPWTQIRYLAPGFTGTTSAILTAVRAAEVFARTVVVHDADGGRIACGLIEAQIPPVQIFRVNSFSKYPSYAGSLDVSGYVDIGQHGDSAQSLRFALAGADPRCTDAGTFEGNSCGIHIHSGTTCAAAGDHHWTVGGLVSSDPWTQIRYLAPGFAGTTFPIQTGISGPDVVGRTVVVHDADGGRVACGEIEAPLQTFRMSVVSKYPGYAGSLEVYGHVDIGQYGDGAQSLKYALAGTDPSCIISGNFTGNSCGIHIHEGTTCAEAGGHHWTQGDLVSSDPWTQIRYIAPGSSGNTFAIQTGVSGAEVLGRTVVVHDAVGDRVACGLIEAQVLPPAEIFRVNAFSKYPGYEGALEVSGYIDIGQHGDDSQSLRFALAGADPRCTDNETFEGNSCGIHIHAGTSCAAAGGHHWGGTVSSDPWTQIRYLAPGSTGNTFPIQTGISGPDVMGRTFVVHDADGGRVACGLIEAPLQTMRVSSFSKYPGYAGSLAVYGHVDIGQYGNSTQSLKYALAGADPRCTEDQPWNSNSCGVHIHEGTTCAKAGGHHWTSGDLVSSDPWTQIRYLAPGYAGTIFPIQTAVSGAGVLGRTAVVHDADGERVACGLIEAKVPPPVAVLRVNAFSWYPGYEGDLNVSGYVDIGQHGENAQSLKYALAGADPRCTDNETFEGNSCGIHIHEGRTCADAGGHHWAQGGQVNEDPWVQIRYIAPSFMGSTFPISTGISGTDLAGRTFVVHDADGGRIACGLIEASLQTMRVSAFSKYPGYAGNLEVYGYVDIGHYGDVAQSLKYALAGADPRCTGDHPVNGNSCGIHIHEGTTCAEAGGHHWTSGQLVSSDPWTQMRYLAPGYADTTFAIQTAVSAADVLGRTVVVHDADGGRVACGLIEAKVQPPLEIFRVNAFSKYPGYEGDLNVSGYVDIGQHGEDAQSLRFVLAGADPRCTDNETFEGNSCGIHVHEGTTCAEAGGHHWGGLVSSDPWTQIRYVAPRFAGNTFPIRTGIRGPDVVGRTFVVHDAEGGRVACGLVEAPLQTMRVSAFSKYPGYAGSLQVYGYVDIEQFGNSAQSLKYVLAGADPRCTEDKPWNGNSCGIHIHEGTTCADAGGHHWTPVDFVSSDPWTQIRYLAPGYAGTTFAIQTAVSGANVLGRTVVVHDADGGRVACGLIEAQIPLLLNVFRVNALSTYPGYTGNLEVSGYVDVGQHGDNAQSLRYVLTGADPRCTENETFEGNSCGIHIHEGTTCAEAGGHHWTMGDLVSSDPWTQIRYLAPSFIGSTVAIQTAVSGADVMGRTVVIHDADGGRVACGPIEAPLQTFRVSAFSKYPGYNGNLEVSGYVDLGQHGNSAQSLEYLLAGADPRCTDDIPLEGNRCGIHIHEGTKCADAGGHHWTQGGVVTSDPWVHTRYVAPGLAGNTFAIQTGVSGADVVGRTVVIHDADATRIACGLIQAPVERQPWNWIVIFQVAFIVVLATGALVWFCVTQQRSEESSVEHLGEVEITQDGIIDQIAEV